MSEGSHQAGLEHEDYHALGFSNSTSLCRCVGRYCQGLDSDCLNNPETIATLSMGKST